MACFTREGYAPDMHVQSAARCGIARGLLSASLYMFGCAVVQPNTELWFPCPYVPAHVTFCVSGWGLSPASRWQTVSTAT
jgi:hypothetical protein